MDHRTGAHAVVPGALWRGKEWGRDGKGDQGPGAAYNAATKFYSVYSGNSSADHDLRIAHVGYDRTHTTAEDSNTWFPLPALRPLAEAGRIGEVAPRFHGAP